MTKGKVTIGISKDCRAFINETLLPMRLVGFDKDIPMKDVFFFLLALGIEEPAASVKKKESFVRGEYLQIPDEAKLLSIKLGKLSGDEDLNSAVDLAACEDEGEFCAESGFNRIKELYEECDGKNVDLERELIEELEEKYNRYFVQG